MIYVIISITTLFSLIMLFELIAYFRLIKKILNCFRRNSSKRFRKQFTSDIELLYAEVKQLSPEIFRRLKFTVRSMGEDTFTSKMVTTEFTTIATIIAVAAMIITCIVAVDPHLIAPLLVDMMNYSLVLAVSIALMSIALIIHLKVEDNKKAILVKFNIVIDEIEKEQSIIVRLSEDQYQALLISSGVQRNMHRFGRSENH